MAVALDADAVIGFLDRSDALHDSAAHEVGTRVLAAREPLIVSAITFAGVLTGALLGHREEGPVRGFFAELVSEVVPVDLEVAEAGARLRSRERLPMPDALMLASARLHPEISALITGDREIARLPDPGVEIVLLEG